MDSPEKVMKKEAIFKNELFQEQLVSINVLSCILSILDSLEDTSLTEVLVLR